MLKVQERGRPKTAGVWCWGGSDRQDLPGGSGSSAAAQPCGAETRSPPHPRAQRCRRGPCPPPSTQTHTRSVPPWVRVWVSPHGDLAGPAGRCRAHVRGAGGAGWRRHLAADTRQRRRAGLESWSGCQAAPHSRRRRDGGDPLRGDPLWGFAHCGARSAPSLFSCYMCPTVSPGWVAVLAKGQEDFFCRRVGSRWALVPASKWLVLQLGKL